MRVLREARTEDNKIAQHNTKTEEDERRNLDRGPTVSAAAGNGVEEATQPQNRTTYWTMPQCNCNLLLFLEFCAAAADENRTEE